MLESLSASFFCFPPYSSVPPYFSSSSPVFLPHPLWFSHSFSVYPPVCVGFLAWLPWPVSPLQFCLALGLGFTWHSFFLPFHKSHIPTNKCLSVEEGPGWLCFRKPVCSQGPCSHQPQPLNMTSGIEVRKEEEREGNKRRPREQREQETESAWLKWLDSIGKRSRGKGKEAQRLQRFKRENRVRHVKRSQDSVTGTSDNERAWPATALIY